MKLKRKVYMTAMRPAMMYGLETVAKKKSNEMKVNVLEMRFLR